MGESSAVREVVVMGCVEVSSRCLFGLGAGEDGDGGEVDILAAWGRRGG